MKEPATILWLRRDLRLSDHAALSAAAADGAVIPVFILDSVTEAGPGAAAKLRLKAAIERLAEMFRAEGVKLILRRGEALPVLLSLVEETGAEAVRWTRLTDGPSLDRDRAVKAALKARGLKAESHDGFTLLDPWRVKTGAGAAFKVFTPFSRALMGHDVPPPLPRAKLTGYQGEIASDRLEDWKLEAGMGPAAPMLAERFRTGEDAARDRLDEWLEGPAAHYADDRDRLDRPDATTRLSEYLALGEISPRMIWSILDRSDGGRGVEAARRQLIWRDFAHMLLFHDPAMEHENWRREWAAFPWREDNEDAEAWRRGRTGVPVVDAAMRELWVTGLMHNRARMLVASWLTKHLMTGWQVGEAHFRNTLIDWDPANNAMGWQWVAGSGPDAAPFFRIFNPMRQADTHDLEGKYRKYWLEGDGAKAFEMMRPGRWGNAAYVKSVPDMQLKREIALAAWKEMRQNREIESEDL